MISKSLMIQGTGSGVGKSILCAAFCRIFSQDGLRTAPFKSQNMSLNSFVTRDGLEMARSQVVQAEAAGVEPSVDMNPLLLKPNSDTGCQVVLNGGRAIRLLPAGLLVREQAAVREDGAISARLRVWGTYLHGLFDSDGFRRSFLDEIRQQKGIVSSPGFSYDHMKQEGFDKLAALVRASVDMKRVYELLGR